GLSRDGAMTWEPTVGWDAGQISDFTFHPTNPDIVWAGTLSGPHVSFDGGRSWADRRDGMLTPAPGNFGHPYAVETVLFDPSDTTSQTLLAFGGDHRELKFANPNQTQNYGFIWRSTDSGQTWSVITDLDANIVAADYVGGSSDQLWVAAFDKVYRSTGDGAGASWLVKNNGLPAMNSDVRLTGIVGHPTDPDVALLTIGVRQTSSETADVGGIFKTTDGGDNWIRVEAGVTAGNNPPEFRHIDISSDGNTVWASDINWGQSKGLWRSTDGGDTWTHVLTQTNAPQLIVGGTPMTTGSAIGAWWVEIDPNDSDRVYAGTSGFVIRTEDGGTTWKDVVNQRDDNSTRFRSNGYTGYVANNFEVSPYDSSLHVAQGWDRLLSGISRDDGFYWEIGQPGLPDFNGGRDVAFAPNGLIFAALGQAGNTSQHVARSTDSGQTWEILASPTGALGVADSVHVSPINPAEAWVVIDGTLYRSINADAPAADVTWNVRDINGLTVESIWPTTDTPNSFQGDDFYIVTEDGVYQTNNGGWAVTRVGGTDPINPSERVRLSVPNDNSGELWASSNGVGAFFFDGSSWSEVDLPGNADKWAKDVAIDPTNPDRIAIATGQDPYVTVREGTGIWITQDGGQTWTNQNGSLPLVNVNTVDFTPNADRLVIGTSGRGFFVSELDRTEPGTQAELLNVGAAGGRQFEVGTNSAAEGERFIEVPAGSGDNWNRNADAPVAKFYFELTAPESQVSFRGRVQTPLGGNDDSFFVRVNQGPWQLWDTPQNTTGWSWGAIQDRGASDPYAVSLDAGVHVLEFKHREDGTRLDAVDVIIGIPGTGASTSEPGLRDDRLFSEDPITQATFTPNAYATLFESSDEDDVP
ncbi:MAG: hypothetical protein AAF561_12230, partial [Planctomycetota bacterium]